MRKVLFLLAVLLVGYAPIAGAQLLKKIKDKAEKKILGDESGGSSDASSSGSGSGSASGGDKFESADYGSVISKLRKDEKFIYGESCLMIKDGKESFSFVTRYEGKYYYYEDGQMQGPFDKPPVEKLWCWGKSGGNNNGNVSGQSSKDMNPPSKDQMIISQTETPFSLKIGGKTYGPYNMVTGLYVDPTETKFFATVMMLKKNSDEIEYYLVSQKSKLKLPNIPGGWIISPNGEHCIIPYFVSQMDGKTEPETDPKTPVILVHEDGTKTGPITNFYTVRSSVFTDNGQWVSNTFDDPKTLSVNGKPTLKFSTDINSFSSVLLNDDATVGVYFDNGSLEFSDGTSIRNEAMYPRLGKENGKVIVKWIAIDKDGNIYACKKSI